MNFVLVARDIAPSSAFERLGKELIKNGSEVTAFLGKGKPLNITQMELIKVVANTDIALIGMSSSKELSFEEVLAATTAAASKRPYGFYADTYGCYHREWFSKVRDEASFLFVINSGEAQKAREIFPHAEVVVSGNSVWEDFCFPKFTREEVRNKLGVVDDEFMVLSPGSKSPVINCILWGAVVEAVHLGLLNSKKWKIFFSTHPGDQTDSVVYNDLMKFSRMSVRLVPKEEMSVSDMISGCDIFIESVSTTGIEVAHQHKPVIDFFSEIALARNESIFGTREWEPCLLGVARDIYNNPLLLSREIHRLLLSNHEDDFAYRYKMRVNQEREYPQPPEKGTAVKIMADTLKKYAANK